MQRQSQVVLDQIAAGVEYDEKTSTFTFTPEDDKKHNENPGVIPPEIPDKPDEGGASGGTGSNEASGSTGASEESQTPSSGGAQSDAAAQTTLPPDTQSPEATHTTAKQNSDIPMPPPQEGVYPPEHEGGMRPPEKPEGDFNDNDKREGEYSYPMPDEYRKQYYGETPQIGSDENGSSHNAFGEEESAGTLYGDGDIIQIANRTSGILDGYTVMNITHTAYDNVQEGVQKETAPVPKSFGSIDFFIIMADKSGKFLAAMNNDELEADVAQQYISAIMSEDASNGMLNNFQFCRSDKSNGTLMVFTDKQAELDMLDQLTRTTILIGVVSFALLSVLAYFFSKKSIEPIKIAFEKQKQFVSDASHELKTPLTVISANADVLSGEIGENKWLEYIKSQTERMNVLVNDLLNLTRLENDTSEFIRVSFNLSQAITNTALPFECQAFEANKIFDVDVEDGIFVNGSENHIKQMTAIFIDNALKYSNDGGTVRVMLKKQGDKSVLSVFNTGSGVKESEKHKIFERFYRSDDSRSRMTGGYGLGLAIAKSIIDKHRFKITVENHEGESICFNIIM